MIKNTKRKPTPEFLIQSVRILYGIIAQKNNKSIDKVSEEIHHQILTELHKDERLRKKVNGMCYRNYINLESEITDDVLQVTFLQLTRYNREELFIMYCDTFSRLIGLFTRIASFDGFKKLKQEISPNQSVAKQILFASNLSKADYIDTNSGYISTKEGFLYDLNLSEQQKDEEVDVWLTIKQNLNNDENEFLNFILENIYNKKNIRYSRTLNKNYMSYNEYKMNFQILKMKIKDIAIKNNLPL